ncbi:MAG: C40 family peptidase [Lachnospiraceae bacterium]|nr:C40 family peptidase [Lachnospiraceae bacterium]
MRYGICNKPIAPLYEQAKFCFGPSDLSSGIADEVLYGWLVKINDEATVNVSNSAFVTTEYGYSGYIDLNDFIIYPSFQERSDVYYVDRSCMDILSEPRVAARVLMTLFRGSYVRIKMPLASPEGWVTLLLNNGGEGFVQACMLKKRILPLPVSPCAISQTLSANNQLREAIASSAQRYLGAQYRWGGKTPLGIDCSGLTFMSYFENGIYIYRDAKLKDDYPVKKIPIQMIGVGDLLYFPGHIALYLGNNQYIHSTTRAGSFGVAINSLDARMPNFRADLYEKLTDIGSVFA